MSNLRASITAIPAHIVGDQSSVGRAPVVKSWRLNRTCWTGNATSSHYSRLGLRSGDLDRAGRGHLPDAAQFDCLYLPSLSSCPSMPKAQSAKSPRHFVMDRWLAILEDEPMRMPDPPILYHYTNAFGVYGILSSNALWATATQFSNDSSEIDYAVAVAPETVGEIWGKKTKLARWERVLAEHLVQLLQTPLHQFGQPALLFDLAPTASAGRLNAQATGGGHGSRALAGEFS